MTARVPPNMVTDMGRIDRVANSPMISNLTARKPPAAGALSRHSHGLPRVVPLPIGSATRRSTRTIDQRSGIPNRDDCHRRHQR
jgi:hypothetical protein